MNTRRILDNPADTTGAAGTATNIVLTMQLAPELFDIPTSDPRFWPAIEASFGVGPADPWEDLDEDDIESGGAWDITDLHYPEQGVTVNLTPFHDDYDSGEGEYPAYLFLRNLWLTIGEGRAKSPYA